jgi:hypothetical protein
MHLFSTLLHDSSIFDIYTLWPLEEKRKRGSVHLSLGNPALGSDLLHHCFNVFGAHHYAHLMLVPEP